MKKISVIALGVMLSGGAMAADAASLDLNVRRIGLEWSKTEVKHADQYQDSPVSALKADSQDFIKGIFDTALEYKRNRLQCCYIQQPAGFRLLPCSSR